MSDIDDKPEPTFAYVHKRTSQFPYQLTLSSSFQRDIIYERIRNAIVLYLDSPMEDEHSESYMIQPSVMRWVESMVPEHHNNFDFCGKRGVFRFKHKHHAMMFKLTFSDGFIKAG